MLIKLTPTLEVDVDLDLDVELDIDVELDTDIPGPQDKRLTGNGEKLTYSCPPGCWCLVSLPFPGGISFEDPVEEWWLLSPCYVL